MEEFKKGLEDEKIQKFESTTIGTLTRELKKIQDEQDKTKSLRNLGRVQGFIEAIEQLSKLIEGFVEPSRVICFIWGPIQLLLQVMAAAWLPCLCLAILCPMTAYAPVSVSAIYTEHHYVAQHLHVPPIY